MKCEELEAIVFSGKEPTKEQRMQMQEHAKSCEACRALLSSAELLGGMCINSIEPLRGNRLMLRGVGMTDRELEILGIAHAGE